MIKNKKGMAYIMACVLLLTCCMMLSMLMSFLSTITLIRHQNDMAEKVLDSFVVRNAIDIYNSVKQGNGGHSSLDSTVFGADLAAFSQLDNVNNSLYSYHEDGRLRYYLSQSSLAAASVENDDSALQVTACYTMYIPLYFGSAQVSVVTLPVEIVSNYRPKF